MLLMIAIVAALALCLAASAFIPGPPDAELVLQAATTKTASFDSAWLDMGPGFAPGGLGMPVAGVVSVSAIDTADQNETYSFVLQEAVEDEDGEVDTGTIRAIGAALAVTATGLSVCKGFITARYVRLSLVAAGTTTRGGLKVTCRLDTSRYPTGVKITQAQMATIRVEPDAFHGEWNDTIHPRQPAS